MTALLTASGVSLLVLLAVDVFDTVFDPEGHGEPLTRLQSRLVAGVDVGAAKRRRQEHMVLPGRAGPRYSTPATWSLILVGGFALMANTNRMTGSPEFGFECTGDHISGAPTAEFADGHSAGSEVGEARGPAG